MTSYQLNAIILQYSTMQQVKAAGQFDRLPFVDIFIFESNEELARG